MKIEEFSNSMTSSGPSSSSPRSTLSPVPKSIGAKKKSSQKGPKTKKSGHKRCRSPGIRLVNGKIYDSDNGKTCHQCRQKTLAFSVSCKNLLDKRECTYHYCHVCLLNRYGEIAEEKAALGSEWKCPRCRGVCNCSNCMKKRGLKPTGQLFPAAKAKGFSSVSEMLQFEKVELPKENKGPQWIEDISAEVQSGKTENGIHETPDPKVWPKANVNGKRKSKKLVRKRLDDHDNLLAERMEGNAAERMKISSFDSNLKLPAELCSETEVSVDTVTARRAIENSPVEEVLVDQKNEVEMQIPDIELPLPQGTELTKVADIELPADDVGHALQFLEFCEAFAQVLGLEKGHPELLLKELLSGQDSHGSHRCSLKALYIKLLSMIQNDSEEGCSSEESLERNPLLEALSNGKSLHIPMDLTQQYSDLKLGGCIELNSSKKLMILNFLCDEALGTQELRNWIEVNTSELVEQKKETTEIFMDLEKIPRKKLQDDIAKAIVLRNGVPFSVEEHQKLVSLIKEEVSKSLPEKPAENKERKMQESCAARTNPVVMDAYGRKFWKLKGYSSEMDILRQDVAHGDINLSTEKWFAYDSNEKSIVERYMSSFKNK